MNTSEKHTLSAAEIARDGICIALVFAATCFINIRLPIGGNGGLIHLGNVPLFLAAILFGRRTGALSGGLGMALFDIISGWALWAPFTLITVGLMGYTVGAINEKHSSFAARIISMLLALIIKLVGYYIAEAVIYGSLTVPLLSIPGNILQVSTAIVIVVPIEETIRHALRAQRPAAGQ